MTKKTFNIASLFNSRTDDKCLEELLVEVLAEQTLDQQDVIDIIETAANNQRKHYQFYSVRKDTFRPTPGQPMNFGQFGYPNRFSNNQAGMDLHQPHTYTTGEHPEFFENLFRVVEFEIRYHTTVLCPNFKFLGVNGKDELTYLGRDKEVLTIKGAGVFTRDSLVVHLIAQNTLGLGMLHIQPTQASLNDALEALRDGSMAQPGMKPFTASTRELINHLRNQAWRLVSEGDLVTLVDRQEVPETVFLVGRMEQQEEYNGLNTQAVVMPVHVHFDGKEVSTTPLGGGIQKVDLMLLKPWVYKG